MEVGLTWEPACVGSVGQGTMAQAAPLLAPECALREPLPSLEQPLVNVVLVGCNTIGNFGCDVGATRSCMDSTHGRVIVQSN